MKSSLPESSAPETQDDLIPPPQPRILAEIEELMRKPNLNLRAIAKLVSQDAGLSTVFLRTVNSSFYGLQNKIETAEQAIPLIGLQQTLNIIRAEALKRVAGGDRFALAHSRLQDRAQGVARLCMLIANHYLPSYLPPDQAYLVGQFHDCGIPILMQHYADYCAAINSPTNPKWPDVLAEDQRVRVNHCEIGHRLAKDWKLPQPVCAAILHHHNPMDADEDTIGLVATLQLALHLYSRMTRNDDSEWERVQEAALKELEIAPENLEEFEHDVRMAYRMQEGE